MKVPPPSDQTFASSSFCWARDLSPARNQFVSFELRFTLAAPVAATLHLFADSRYRLFVNETFLAYGPGRFVTAHPEYDTHDLAPHLHPGENTLRVEVNYYGCSSYQTMPDGLPGFIAAGGTADGSKTFATPGNWIARIHQAWDAQAPHFSFAQNPAEICDTRILAAELAVPAARPVEVLPTAATPWPKPTPRSAPYPDYAPIRPARVMVSGPLAEARRWGIQMHLPGCSRTKKSTGKQFVSFATWIHSPRAQTVSLDCFWLDLELNGQPLAIDYDTPMGNHGQTSVALRAGWNFLSGNIEVLREHWSLLIGLPPASNATLHARPDGSDTETFALSGLLPERFLLPCPTSPESYTVPAGWNLATSDLSRVTPARLVAWDAPDASACVREVPFSSLPKIATHTALAALWSFDFGDEFYGHPVIEVEAPAGSVLDIAYDDWKRADGCVNLYQSNPFTNAVDRFILRGGRQRIEVLNPRGGIFLQIVLRVPAGSPPSALAVQDVAVRRRTTLHACEGAFTCGDPLLDWAWHTSIHTLQASTDESYADCPWRERGSYIGDSLVNFHLNRILTTDLSVARRTLDFFGKAQLPDGQLTSCAPAWLTTPLEDFSLIWIQAVRDYWAHTGEIAFAADQWPVIQRIFASPTWKADADGLWDTTGMHVFIDWGVLKTEREGAGNAAVNILRIAALRAAAEIATTLGHTEESVRYTVEAGQIATALIARVWNEAEGRFNASIGAATPAVHANILALRYRVGPTARILAYLEPLLCNNFKNGIERGQSAGFAELYFFHYLLPALVAHNRVALAESMIQETYGHLQNLGYPTLTECFHRAHQGHGSCCHSWSGAPAIFATDHILGLRLATPGQPNAFVLAPVASRHSHAEGTLPHAHGPIHVRWERRGDRIAAQATLPPGVTLTPAPYVDLSSGPA